MWCLEQRIRNQHDLGVVAVFEVLYPVAFFVEQVGRHLDGQLRNHLCGALLARLFADDAQDRQGQRFDAANAAKAGAARARHVRRLADRRAQSLAGHLEQAEAADLADLHASTVLANRFAQPVFNVTLVLRRTHVDEVDYDEAAEVADTQLTRDFLGRFEVGVQRSCLDVPAFRRAGGVDVDGDERLGVIDHDAAAGGQVHGVRESRLDL